MKRTAAAFTIAITLLLAWVGPALATSVPFELPQPATLTLLSVGALLVAGRRRYRNARGE
jgi:hypothetical protein